VYEQLIDLAEWGTARANQRCFTAQLYGVYFLVLTKTISTLNHGCIHVNINETSTNNVQTLLFHIRFFWLLFIQYSPIFTLLR
jgi:hypothetical protein